MTEWAVNCPFHFAASEGDLRSVRQYMEERKNKPEEKDELYKNTPLHYAAQGGHLPVVIYLVKEQKANINSVNMYGDTPLHCAAWWGRAHVVEWLLQNGADCRQKNAVMKSSFDWILEKDAKHNDFKQCVLLLEGK